MRWRQLRAATRNCSARWQWVWRASRKCRGYPAKRTSANPTPRRANLERAELILAALTARAPQEMGWRRDLGRVRYLLALVYGAQDNNGTAPAAKGPAG